MCSSGNWEIYFVLEHGQVTSSWPGVSGDPTECSAFTKTASVPIAANASLPIRAIILIDATT